MVPTKAPPRTPKVARQRPEGPASHPLPAAMELDSDDAEDTSGFASPRWGRACCCWSCIRGSCYYCWPCIWRGSTHQSSCMHAMRAALQLAAWLRVQP